MTNDHREVWKDRDGTVYAVRFNGINRQEIAGFMNADHAKTARSAAGECVVLHRQTGVYPSRTWVVRKGDYVYKRKGDTGLFVAGPEEFESMFSRAKREDGDPFHQARPQSG